MVEKYQLEILPEAISDLKKLDKVINQRILKILFRKCLLVNLKVCLN